MARAVRAEYHDFDAEEVETSFTPCVFKLGGKEWSCRPTEQVPFHVVERILEAARNDPNSAIQVGPFFRSVLVPEQVEEFMTMLNAPDSPLTLGLMPKVMEHVSTHVLNRPTERPSSSGAGSRRTGATSKAARSSPATRASTA